VNLIYRAEERGTAPAEERSVRKSKKPWTVQWHIAADGTVIRQRSKGEQPHLQLYGSYATVRRVELSDLEALDERLDRDRRVIGGLAFLLLAFGVVSGVCLVVGVVLSWLGVDAGGLLMLVGWLLLVIGLVGSGASHGMIISRGNRAWTEAGFESSNPVTMAASEARAMIEAPGSVSGRKTRVERA
jgi:hypothetical protein